MMNKVKVGVCLLLPCLIYERASAKTLSDAAKLCHKALMMSIRSGINTTWTPYLLASIPKTPARCIS